MPAMGKMVGKAQVALPESFWLEWLEASDTLEFPCFFLGTDDSNTWGVDEKSQMFDQILDELGELVVVMVAKDTLFQHAQRTSASTIFHTP